jgi:predicted dienelactone hydrolase
MNRIASICLLCFLAAHAALCAQAGIADVYDPLQISQASRLEWLDLLVYDTGRQRPIPIRVYRPATSSPAPVILFSHGLGGSRAGSAYLGKHWSARGYLCVFLQHTGDDSPRLENVLLRAKDVPAVLDQLEKWNKTQGHALAGRLDLTRIGMSGHSFGAVTTQAVSGQKFSGRLSLNDPRIKAALLFSPSSPRRPGEDPKTAFGSVKIPWMLMTGTKDVGNPDVKLRLAVFPALPPGGKYELVLDGARHSAFADPALSSEPNHHRAILALSTAFWDAWLRKDAAAKAWLEGASARSVLEKGDRWQIK